jgi:hypothetical protein
VAETWRTWSGVLAATAAALPFAVLLAVMLARARRRRGAPRHQAWRRSVAEVGLVVGTLPWLWMILTPGAAPGRPAGRMHLVPLRDLAAQLSGDPGTAFAQVAGNLLVFAALGAGAPIRWPALASLPRLCLLGAAVSVLVEAAQYTFTLGRVASIDDVLLNTLGAVLGGLITRRWWDI